MYGSNAAQMLFAVPRSEDLEYFALDFADRNREQGGTCEYSCPCDASR